MSPTHLDPIANDNVIPLFDGQRCSHRWEPIEGWRARYRCCNCGCVGRKQELVARRSPNKPGPRPGITPYRCRFRRDGVQCSAHAVVCDDGKHRCAVHARGAHTRKARLTLDDK